MTDMGIDMSAVIDIDIELTTAMDMKTILQKCRHFLHKHELIYETGHEHEYVLMKESFKLSILLL